MIRKEYNKNHGKWFVSDCLRAIRRYNMIEEGQAVCVALSGGKDSGLLLYVLWYITKYTSLSFPLFAAHIKTDTYDPSVLAAYCAELGVSYLENTGERVRFAGGVGQLEAVIKQPGLVDRILLSFERLELKDLWQKLPRTD